MSFQKGQSGNPGGRPRGSIGGQSKAKFLSHWLRIFEQEGLDILQKLAKENPAEFMRLGIQAMPKNLEANLNIGRFDSWTDEELDHFIATGGAYPDHDDSDG